MRTSTAQRPRVDAVRVVVRKISQQAAAVRRLPPEKFVGEGGELVRPHQLLGDEIIHP